MNSQRDTPLRKALRQAAALPDPRPAEAFWQDFKARAALSAPAASARPAAAVGAGLVLRWGLAAAALTALVLTVALLHRPAALPELAVTPVVATPALSKVEEVELFSEYSSVMIVEDIENGGTVIWVASATP